MYRPLSLLIVLLLCTSCGVQRLTIKSDNRVKELKVYYHAEGEVLNSIVDGLGKQLDNIIAIHNAERGHPFKLVRTDEPDSATLTIHLLASRLVSRQTQTTAAVVSVVGLSLPFVMAASGASFYIFFYYFPTTRSMLEFSLSPDINGSDFTSTNRLHQSPGFLKSEERQIQKHQDKFAPFLRGIIRELERSYR